MMAEADGCEDCYDATFCGLYFKRMVTVFGACLVYALCKILHPPLHLLSILIIGNNLIYHRGSLLSKKARDLEGAACFSFVQPKKISNITTLWFHFAISYNSNMPFLYEIQRNTSQVDS